MRVEVSFVTLWVGFQLFSACGADGVISETNMQPQIIISESSPCDPGECNYVDESIPICTKDGEKCSFPEQCCSQECHNEVCGACLQDGEECSSPKQCCSGECNGETCGVTPCLEDGEKCSSPKQCCNGECNQEVCGVPACLEDGELCSSPEQCCSGECNYQCGPPQMQCVGNAMGCRKLDKPACKYQKGCRWSICRGCIGNPAPCESFTDQVSCRRQLGCSWEEKPPPENPGV